jgi:hypothetical protein
MRQSIKFFRTLGSILFLVGILLGLFLAGGLTWANLEADFYFGFGARGEIGLDMTCPLIMTPAETGRATITLANSSERLVEPLVQVDISGPIGRSFRERVPVEAGAIQTASWEVGDQDLAFGHLILVKVYQFAALSLPSADASCGILVLSLGGLSGQDIYLLILVASVALAALGFLLWGASYRANKEHLPNEMGGMLLLSAIVGVAVLVGSLGWWFPALLVLAACVLLTAILIARQVNAQR